MIRFIVAIDSKNGIANENGIPWKGKIPSDTAYYRGKIRNHTYIVGYGTYSHYKNPIPDTHALVATSKKIQLKSGYQPITNPRKYIESTTEDIWVGGGEVIYAELFDLADELYITQLEGDYGCTKFFPEFHANFKLNDSSETHTENGIKYTFQVWVRK